jgi:hypothetical protein
MTEPKSRKSLASIHKLAEVTAAAAKADALLPRVDQLPQLPTLNEEIAKGASLAKVAKALGEVRDPSIRRQFLDGATARASLDRTRSLRPAIDMKTELTALSETFLELNARMAEQFSKALKPVLDSLRPKIAQVLGGVGTFIEAQETLSEASDDFVQKQGWPLPIGIPLGLYRRLVGMADAPRNDVKAAMRNGFREGTRGHRHVREVLTDSPAFASRRPLIRQALRAHRRGEWYLVINALLPLVEGVLVDAMFEGDDEPPRGQRPQQAVARLQQSESSFWFWDSAAVNAIETIVLSASAGVGLFAPFDHRDYGRPGEPRRLNRHAILHGSARRYGSELNALKLTLLLVVIGECLDTGSLGRPSAS